MMNSGALSADAIEQSVIEIRQQWVILDSAVASLFGVTVDDVKQTVKNNPERFFEDYVIVLDEDEHREVKEKFSSVTHSDDGVEDVMAFTERGLYMLATLLKSEQATATTQAIIETFSRRYAFPKPINQTATIYDETLITYLDILGFKDVLRFEQKAVTILELLKEISKNINPEASVKYRSTGPNSGEITVNLATAMFSDSLLLSISKGALGSYADWGNAIFQMLYAVTKLVGYSILEGKLLIRGGLVIGKLYHKDGVFLGQGVVDAYRLESSSETKYPGIRVDKAVRERFSKISGFDKRINYFLEEDDGNLYVDIFSLLYEWLPKHEGSFIEDIISVINEKIISIDKDQEYEDLNRPEKEKILFKWKWYRRHACRVLERIKSDRKISELDAQVIAADDLPFGQMTAT